MSYKLLTKALKASDEFKHYNFSITKVSDFTRRAHRNSALRRTARFVFKKRIFYGIAVGTGVGVAAKHVTSYIHTNSGCFLYEKGEPMCKVRELSCCQSENIDGFKDCPSGFGDANTCGGYNEKTEKSCCRLCDCKHHSCTATQQLICRKPTVGEALTFYASSAGSLIIGGLFNVLSQIPILRTMFFGCVAIFVFLLFLWKMR